MPPDHPGDRDAARIALLRAGNLHVTPQRLGVLRALSLAPHSTADDVYRSVRTDLGSVSRQAVYDALAALTERGVLRRIEPAGSPARYEDRVGDNHHHLVCRNCRRLVDVDCAVGEAPCLSPDDEAGFEIDEAEVVYWGRCRECVAQAAGSAQPNTAPPERQNHQSNQNRENHQDRENRSNHERERRV